ncbi:unnamed protein product [Citrullus colocynthis]|uniref:Uncharacterized protein n=1 Tax=Citrullus colocynthis TaxID=252529 RepID=A0ABP0Y9X9_9ROSI
MSKPRNCYAEQAQFYLSVRHTINIKCVYTCSIENLQEFLQGSEEGTFLCYEPLSITLFSKAAGAASVLVEYQHKYLICVSKVVLTNFSAD